jgi:hypothetical protein
VKSNFAVDFVNVSAEIAGATADDGAGGTLLLRGRIGGTGVMVAMAMAVGWRWKGFLGR